MITLPELHPGLIYDEKDKRFQRGDRQDRFRKERRALYAYAVSLFDSVRAIEDVDPDVIPGNGVDDLVQVVDIINYVDVNHAGERGRSDTRITSNDQMSQVRDVLDVLRLRIDDALSEARGREDLGADFRQNLRLQSLEDRVSALEVRL